MEVRRLDAAFTAQRRRQAAVFQEEHKTPIMKIPRSVQLAVFAGMTICFCLRLFPAGQSQQSMAIPPYAVRFQDNCSPAGSEKCVWVFDSYEPSAWEKEWHEGEMSGKRKDLECDVLTQKSDAARSRRLIGAIRGSVLQSKPVPPEATGLFSRMIYAKRCGTQLKDTGERRVQLIEPLVGLLRDPLTICSQSIKEKEKTPIPFDSGEDAVQSKRHLLIGSAAQWTANPADKKSWRIGGFEPWSMDTSECSEPRVRQNVLVDIGASLYGVWNGNSSAVGAIWFVDRYQRHHLNFDRIISYEIEKHDPDDIYKHVPKEILPRYFYFNQGVEAAPNGKWNPWRMLRGMGVTPNDYVVIKLDIDFPDIENPLIGQLLNSSKTGLLVDEVFFEHHVNVKAMWPYWKTEKEKKTLKDSYRLFRALRASGIRMHSWP